MTTITADHPISVRPIADGLLHLVDVGEGGTLVLSHVELERLLDGAPGSDRLVTSGGRVVAAGDLAEQLRRCGQQPG